MSAALHSRASELAAPDPPSDHRRPGPYLRPVRVQPRRRTRAGAVLWLLLAASLLFLKVWERTESNSLAMERDRLSTDVRALSNRIRLVNELTDQASLREGLDFESLRAMGFESPAPSQVIDINLSRPATRALAGPRSLGARALELVQGRGSGAAEASVGGAP